MTNPKLKYRFTAKYKNGMVYCQTSEDISITEPGKSAFNDVDVPNLSTFAISNPDNYYCVDLETGLFKANNGVWFRIDKEDGLTNFRLIYFRRVSKDFFIEDNQEISEDTTYFIGWSADTTDGKKVEYTIAII